MPRITERQRLAALLGGDATTKSAPRHATPRPKVARKPAPLPTPKPQPPTPVQQPPDVAPDWDEETEYDEQDDEAEATEQDDDALSLSDFGSAVAGIFLGQGEPQQVTPSPRAQLRDDYWAGIDAGLSDTQAQSAALRSRAKRRNLPDRKESLARLYFELEGRGGVEVAISTIVQALMPKAAQLKMLPAPTRPGGTAPTAAPLGYGQSSQVTARPQTLPYSGRQARASGLHVAAIAYEGSMRGPSYPMRGR